jgi:hypothetical protein
MRLNRFSICGNISGKGIMSLSKIILALFVSAVSLSASAADIVMLSFDGNGGHDKDDYGALPVPAALLDGTGVCWHVDYNSHSPNTNTTMIQQMRTSANGSRQRFNVTSNWYDHSPGNMASVINGLSSTQKAKILVGGPFEMVWRALSSSNKAKHQYVTLWTHSNWNNTHEHSGTHTLAEIRNAFPTVKVVKIPDQNPNLRTRLTRWNWSRDSQNEEMRFLYARIKASQKFSDGQQDADVSDAGLTMAAVYGNWNASPEDIRVIIE